MLHDVEHNRRLVEVEHAVAARDAAVGDTVLIGSAAIIVFFAAAIYFAIQG